MDKNRKSQIITIVGVSLLAMGICILGATILSDLYYRNNNDGTSSSLSTDSSESTIPVQTTWKNKILFDIPTNVTGDTKIVDVTDVVPFYDGAFSESNVKCFKDKTNPYLSKITVASPEGANTNLYKSNLEDSAPYAYTCDDYFNDVMGKGYIFENDGYRLLVTPFYANYVDNLFIRYIPNGDNWPTESICTGFATNSSVMIPGMNLLETPTVGEIADSSLTFQYNALESVILFYKQTVKYFGYEEIGGLYTNTLNNSVMLDLSVDNQITITAPTK